MFSFDLCLKSSFPSKHKDHMLFLNSCYWVLLLSPMALLSMYKQFFFAVRVVAVLVNSKSVLRAYKLLPALHPVELSYPSS